MALLRYVFGAIEDIDEINLALAEQELPTINYESARKSIDGTRVMMHQENLKDAQLNAIIYAFGDGKPFFLLSNEGGDLATLLASEVWTSSEEEDS